MPELPEVERARRVLERFCVGFVVKCCQVVQDNKVFEGVAPDTFKERMTGDQLAPCVLLLHLLSRMLLLFAHDHRDCSRCDVKIPENVWQELCSCYIPGATILAARRKGKHLWLELKERPWPLIHLGMTGSFAAVSPDGTKEVAEYVNSRVDAESWPPKFWKFRLVMENGNDVAFIAIRRFERVRMQQDPRRESPVKDLGFDPLTDMLPLADFKDELLSRSGPVKGALLDQSFCAGVGNWIADEVLYQARLHPQTPSSSLSLEQVKVEVEAVWQSLQMVIGKACEEEADSSKFPKDWLFHYRWNKKQASKWSNDRMGSSAAEENDYWCTAC
ncbi:hypothetical protein GUITHDRAFT_141036 [Guillardia theta CCMP2712]|uniref:Formamidopyrimidine-DNA glycosylase catalytic domain-containing protein n=1 Tax=Guillardia theta (strain CCMP2712) TaxID=905079 RepID=L1J398_GUITC|nr:hypothetical protein GUITHDRAFT_141036 [Guillardia theta CCMP2712]EKX42614.1 hypothetical protein GUITHDRAFT_141036 [Guillardia theta CCMP2712]|eukprot:XP_005829594.1 hypothetical protein GUITHDRAFT_141036 [Guillardia theta CCMP2712]